MKPSEKILNEIQHSVLEVAETFLTNDHNKYFDICSTFNFLWSIYQCDKEAEERNSSGNWGAPPLKEQEPESSWWWSKEHESYWDIT